MRGLLHISCPRLCLRPLVTAARGQSAPSTSCMGKLRRLRRRKRRAEEIESVPHEGEAVRDGNSASASHAAASFSTAAAGATVSSPDDARSFPVLHLRLHLHAPTLLRFDTAEAVLSTSESSLSPAAACACSPSSAFLSQSHRLLRSSRRSAPSEAEIALLTGAMIRVMQEWKAAPIGKKRSASTWNRIIAVAYK